MPRPDLSSRLGTLPVVLAGPILRQVTDSAVTVWLALKQNATVSLKVYDRDQTNLVQPLMSGTLATTAIGTNLHLVAVTARPQNDLIMLTENKLYFYNLSFSSTDPPLNATFSQAISPQGATTQVKDALAYGGRALPSFVLPPRDLNKLKLIHGSCRKPHAEGHDALATLHDLVDQYASSPLDRPHQLLLTGDQIYADDVADGLLLMLMDASRTLLQWSETLVIKPGEKATLANWASYYRTKVLSSAQFTSDDLKSHLITLGEFISMYLFAWSDVLWPKDLPVFEDILQPITLFVRSDRVSKLAIYFRKSLKSTMDKELKYIANFRSTLPNVRRALANIPTYMIFDDHEVTDDWNATRRFCSQVYGTPLGLRVVQNGLAAFSLCQAWGNDPDRFAGSAAGAVLLDTLGKVAAKVAGAAAGTEAGSTAAADAYENSSAAIQKIVGVHPATVVSAAGRVFHNSEDNVASTNPDSLRFNFRIEGTGHLILVTDTRTWRGFPSSAKDAHGDFLASYAAKPEMLRQLSLTKPLDDRLLLVVLTTNAPPIASFRFAARHPGFVNSVSHVVDNIKEFFVDPPTLTASAPVKYSGSVRAIYEYDLQDSWDLPSGPFDHSAPFDNLVVHLDSLLQAQRRTEQVILLSGDVHSSFASRLTVFGQDPQNGVMGKPRMVIAQLVASALKNQAVKTRGQQLEGYTYAPKEIARHPIPSFVPEALEGPKLSGVISDSVYRLDYLVATAGQTSTMPFLDPLPVAEGQDVANLRNYAKMHKLMGVPIYSGASDLQIIGHNNIAELKFIWGSADKRAQHILHWSGPDGTLYTTTYDVSLNLNDATYKMLSLLPFP
jgi:hypothetical protein